MLWRGRKQADRKQLYLSTGSDIHKLDLTLWPESFLKIPIVQLTDIEFGLHWTKECGMWRGEKVLQRKQSKEDKGSDRSWTDRGKSMLEKLDRGAKDMSVPKRKHFVELKHVWETASYLNDDRDPFKGSHVTHCVLEVLLWDHLRETWGRGWLK